LAVLRIDEIGDFVDLESWVELVALGLLLRTVLALSLCPQHSSRAQQPTEIAKP
jgi:hypothetical protein